MTKGYLALLLVLLVPGVHLKPVTRNGNGNGKAWNTTTGVVPLVRAYAHNDQENRAVPLIDALDLGFCHVETDVNLIGDEVVIGHDCRLLPGRCNETLLDFYLLPLGQYYEQNGGFVFGNAKKLRSCETMTLLADVKTAADPTFQAIERDLALVESMYPGLFSRFEYDQVARVGAVEVLISGNRLSPQEMSEMPLRHSALDGRVNDNLNDDWTVGVIPWLSQNWNDVFDTTETPFPSEVVEELQEILRIGHERGQKVRFWSTPHNEDFWAELVRYDVDIINTDNYEQLQEFLLN